MAIDVPDALRASRSLKARDVIVDYRPRVGIRVSPHFYNTFEELDRLVQELAEILALEGVRRHLVVAGHLPFGIIREPLMSTLWNHRYAQRTQRMTSSVIRELLKLTALPDIISFAGGLPGARSVPGRGDEGSRRGGARDEGPASRCSTAPPRATRRCAR